MRTQDVAPKRIGSVERRRVDSRRETVARVSDPYERDRKVS